MKKDLELSIESKEVIKTCTEKFLRTLQGEASLSNINLGIQVSISPNYSNAKFTVIQESQVKFQIEVAGK